MRKNRIRKWLSVLLSGMMAISALTPVAASAQTPATTPTKTTLSVTGQPLHLQGIAVDTENSNMYWSFTETLVKTDLNGNKIKQVEITGGHLGDLAYYDGKIYGSLLGAPLDGHVWNDWTGYYLMVFDTDLNLLQKVELTQFQTWADHMSDTTVNPYGIYGLDGVTIGKAPDGTTKLMIAAGIEDAEANTNQVVVQYSLDGKFTYEKCYPIFTGNLPFGTQNITYDSETGHYWLACYGKEQEWQSDENLFEVDADLSTVLGRWKYGTAYGLAAAGGGVFWTSGDGGQNGNKTGYAYLSQYDETNGMVPYAGEISDLHIESNVYYNMNQNTIIHTVPVEGKHLKDTGTLGLDAALNEAQMTTGPDGSENSALSFTANSSASITINQAKVLNGTVGDDLTISCWVKVDADAKCDGDQFMYIAGLTDVNGRYIASFEASWNCFIFHVSGSDNTNEAWADASALERGKWYHLTGVYSGTTGKASLYVNGTLAKQSSGGAPIPMADIAYLSIGKEPIANAENINSAYPHKTTDFLGSVSDLRVYSSALSSAQAAALKSGDETAVGSKSAVQYLMNEANLADSEEQGGENPAPATPTTLKDSSGNGYDMAIENVTYQNSSLVFANNSKAVLTGTAITAIKQALVAADQMTLMLDVTPDASMPTNKAFIGGLLTADRKTYFSAMTRWNCLVVDSGIAYGDNGESVPFGSYPADNANYTAGTKYQLAIVYDGAGGDLGTGGITYYINGVKQRANDVLLKNVLSQLDSLQLGGIASDFSAFVGRLGNIRLYDKALSGDDVAAVAQETAITSSPLAFYNTATDPTTGVAAPETPAPTTPKETTTVLDQSGNGLNAAADNSITVTADKTGTAGTAIAFDGSNKIALTGDKMTALKNDITTADAAAISAWVKVDKSNGSFSYIAGLQNEDGNFALALDSSWGNLVLRMLKPDGNYSTTIYPSSGAYTLGEWYHVVVTVNEASAVLYINGVKQGTATSGTGILDHVASFSVGNTVKTAPLDSKHTGFIGAADDVHVFARFMNEEMVRKLYEKPETAYIDLDAPSVPVTEKSIWTADWRQQIFRTDVKAENAPSSIALETACNESEPAQVVLRADGDFTINDVVFSDLTSGGNTISADQAEFHYVGYSKLVSNTPGLTDPVQSAPGWFPEQLLNSKTIAVKPNSTQPIWVRYTIPKDAAAGAYQGTVTVKTTMGDFTVPVSVNVRNVTLPDPENGTFDLELWGQLVKCFEDTGNDLDVIGKAYGIEAYSDEWWSLMETYAKFMKENRMNSLFVNVADLLADAPGTSVAADGTVTYDWSLLDRFVELFLTKGGIKQISAEHLCAQTSKNNVLGYKVEFITEKDGKTVSDYLHFDEGGEAYLTKYLTELNKHLTAKGWSSIWHQHIGDEPTYGDMPTHYKKVAALVHSLCPGVTTGDALYGENMKDFEDAMDVWVPITSAYEDFKEEYEQKIAEGNEVWLYTAMSPSKDYMNRFTDTQLYKSELLGWLCYKYGATGYLHWGLMEWYVWEDFDANDATVGSHNVTNPGDSWCIYPDKENMSIISSIRLEAMREAAEDYELFRLYEQKDEVGAKNLVDSTVRNATNYDNSVAKVAADRLALLNGAEGKYVAPGLWVSKTGNAMKIDGVLDEAEWSESTVQHYELNRMSGNSGLSGNASFLWDNTNLYISVTLNGTADKLDVFLDGNLTQGVYDGKTVQYTLHLADGSISVSGNADAKTTSVSFRSVKESGKGSTVVEVCIPWAALNGFAPKDNSTIGMTLQAANSAGTVGITTPAAEDSTSSAKWAIATLDSTLISKASAKPIAETDSIVIDGVPNESAWKIDKVLGEKFYGNTENQAAFGLLWSNDGLYAAFDVEDDFVINSGAEYCWDDDSVELFLDLDLKSGSYGAATPNVTQLTFRYNDDTVYVCGSPYNAETNLINASLIRHKSARSEKGYTVEIFVPWAAFGRDDIMAGKVLGVTAQMNDKDVDDAAAYEDSALAYTVSETSNGSNSKGWPQFVLTAAEKVPSVERVTVTAPASEVKPGANLQLSAEVAGSNVTQNVIWRVEGAASAQTDISANGLLTVGRDETATSLTVVAMSGDDDTVKGTFTVTVRANGTSGTPSEGGSSENPSQCGSSGTPSQGDQSGTSSNGQGTPATGANASLWLVIVFFALSLAAAGSVVIEQCRRKE